MGLAIIPLRISVLTGVSSDPGTSFRAQSQFDTTVLRGQGWHGCSESTNACEQVLHMLQLHVAVSTASAAHKSEPWCLGIEKDHFRLSRDAIEDEWANPLPTP